MIKVLLWDPNWSVAFDNQMVFLRNGFAYDAIVACSRNDTIVPTTVGKPPIGSLDISLAMVDKDDFIGSSISVNLSLLSVRADAVSSEIFVEHHGDAVGDWVTASYEITGFNVEMPQFLIRASLNFEFADGLR